MKRFLILLVLGLTGCTIMFPDHHAQWAGVRNGKLMYEVECKDVWSCMKDSNRVCEGHPYQVVFRWENNGDHHFMAECQH